MASPNKNAKFKCNQCNKNLTTKAGLQAHERTHTGEKPYPCEMCPKSFVAPAGLVQHRRTHTGEKPYNCTTCGKSFTTFTALATHNLVHTGEKPHACSMCFKSFSSAGNLARHKRVHTGERNYSCTFCDKAYTSRDTLNRHLRVHTGGKPYVCPVTNCRRRFYSANDLASHRSGVHSSQTTGSKASKIQFHTCDLCQLNFSRGGNLRAHKKTQHKTKPSKNSCDTGDKKCEHHGLCRQPSQTQIKSEKCSFCMASFKTRRGLQAHTRRKHTGEKPHGCPKCGTRFCTRGEMMSHDRSIHLKEKPFKCPQCAHAFVSKTNLTRHIRTHSEERPYSCDTCDKRFKSRFEVKTHVMTHVGEKPYVCPECGTRFKSMAGLKGHLLAAHDPAGQAKRQCGVCQKVVTAQHFRDHEKIHTRDKNQRLFSCKTCPKSYYTTGEQLKRHLVRHGPKEHACTLCGTAFHMKCELARHIRTHTRETLVV